MIAIGGSKLVPVWRQGEIVLGSDGQPEMQMREIVVHRVTRQEYGHNSRYRRRLIVKLHGEDLITIRPAGLRTESLVVSINIGTLYKDLLARKALREGLEKARAKKAKLAEQRARRSRTDQERRFRRKLKAGA